MKALIEKTLEGLAKWHQQRFERCWFNADRVERRARLDAITTLIVELQDIQRREIFACGPARGIVEDVIDGDWKRAEEGADYFLFLDEDASLREKYAPIWSTFRALVRGACHEARLRAEGKPTVIT